MWFLLSIGLAISSINLIFDESIELVQQENASQIEAEQYLLEMSEKTDDSASKAKDTENKDNNTESNSDLNYKDDVLYKTHTIKEAQGKIDCVIEIPSIEFRQCIFTGTAQQINHDLKCWLPVTCRSDYILGQTHYAVYMHNPSDRSIKISRAQKEMSIGDYIVLTQGNIVYFYTVSDLFPEYREICADRYANNMSTPNDKLYIFTCGKDEWQGRNIVIEGTIYKTFKLSDWNKNKDKYIEEYKNRNNKIEKIEKKQKLIMDVQSNDDTLMIDIRTPDNNQATDCSVALLDKDGFVVGNETKYNGHPIEIKVEEEGDFFVGIYKNYTDYETPDPLILKVSKESKILSVSKIENIEVKSDDYRLIGKILLIFAIISFISSIVMLILFFRRK